VKKQLVQDKLSYGRWNRHTLTLFRA